MNIRSLRIFAGIVLLAAAAVPLSAQNAGAEEIAGFPLFKSVRGHLQPPVIDGFITDALPDGVKPDSGWRAGARLTVSNGVIVPDAAFQGLKEAKGDFLDLSFEVRHDPSLDEGDAVVIGLRPVDGDSPDGWLENDLVLIVYPFAGEGGAAAVPPGGSPARVEMWKYTAAGWKDVSAEVKGCRWAARAFDATADAKGWDIEGRIPTGTASGGDAWADIPDRFRLYWNVVRVQSGPMPSVSQFFWPRRSRPLSGVLDPSSLSPGGWGRADKFDATVHRGLWIDPADIKAAPVNIPGAAEDFRFAFNDSMSIIHDFSLTVRNEASRVVGTYEDFADVEQASVSVSSAEWGIGGANPGPDWSPLDRTFVPERGFANPAKPKTVPRAENPTKPGAAVFTYRGTVGPRLAERTVTTDRRCLYAELAAPAGTFVRERGTFRNMVFTTVPVFEERAMLSVRGYGAPPAGKTAHAYLLRKERKNWVSRKSTALFTGQEVRTTDASAEESASDINSYLEWTLHGFLLTADTLTVGGRAYPVAVPTGSFGYRVRRPTEVRAWNEYVKNARPLDDATYLLEIAADGAAEIRAGVKADESTGIFVGARAGAAVPLLVYSGSYILGPSVCLEGGIKLTQLLSAFLDVGYNYLVDPAGGSGFNMMFAVLGLRAAVELSPAFYAYLQVGLFGYTPDFVFFDLGFNAGLAAGINLSRNVSLEAGVGYVTGAISEDKTGVVLTNFGLIIRL